MWDIIKSKVKCKLCGDIIISKNNKTWVECSCGAVKIMGKGTFKVIKGKKENYEDLTVSNFENEIPENFRDS